MCFHYALFQHETKLIINIHSIGLHGLRNIGFYQTVGMYKHFAYFSVCWTVSLFFQLITWESQDRCLKACFYSLLWYVYDLHILSKWLSKLWWHKMQIWKIVWEKFCFPKWQILLYLHHSVIVTIADDLKFKIPILPIYFHNCILT